jgi:hypothetical protein
MTEPRPEPAGNPPQLVFLTPARPEIFPHLRKIPEVLEKLKLKVAYWSWQRAPLVEKAEAFPQVAILSKVPDRPFACLLLGYLWWMVRVFWAVLWSRQHEVFVCERFESAFPAAVVTLFRRRRFLFYNSDNLYLSYRWSPLVRRFLLGLERFTARRSAIHLVPSEYRWPAADANRRLLANWPSRQITEAARRIAAEARYARSGPLHVYVNGWLPETRGLRMIAAAAERLADTPIRFIVCGRENGPSARKLISLPNVDYLGERCAATALAQCYRCHIVLTFYDPAIEINRVAEPNKWLDCVVTETPFITNAGILTAKPYQSSGACLTVPYDDDAALEQMLRSLATDPEKLHDVTARLKRIPPQFWDDQMEQILREFMELPAECAGDTAQTHRRAA